MKQGKQHLSEVQRDSIGILYYCVKNALEVSETLERDKSIDRSVRYNLIRMWAINLAKIKTTLDKGLGVNASFDSQIKNTDTIGLHDIVSGYISMSPEGREAVEELFKAIKENGEIKIQVA